MKTIEEAAKDLERVVNGKLSSAFKRGVEFAQRWVPVKEEYPIAFESGNWDGLRSEFVLVKFIDNNWTKARLYSGFMDGSLFNDWVNENDFDLTEEVVSWRPIEIL